MKKNVLILLACLALTSCLGPRPQWQVYFSPRGGAEAAILSEINRATNAVLVQAYSFTSEPIAKALVDASHKPGVKVTIILDKDRTHEKKSQAPYVSAEKIATLIDTESGDAHNKIMLIDEQVVITGSFNFSENAEHKNAENLLVIRDRNLVAEYLANWKLHESHSEAYQAK